MRFGHVRLIRTLPIEDRGRIFESFVQLKRSGEAKQCFGLGLAIVKRVMEWHNGSVVADSSPLGGAASPLRGPLIPAN